MRLYRRTSHTRFDLKYHLVWATKYRRPILVGKVAYRVRDLIREICQRENVQILRGHVAKDHVHLFCSAPPQLSPSTLTQYLKGKTSRKLLQEYRHLSKQFWGQHLWSRGFFVVSSGAITDEQIMDYLQHQDEDEAKRGDNFTVLDATGGGL